ncbi:MAG: hypothetical protein IKP48_08160 [Bacteroidaceae bacterium]|nr:hypothetical protein [Bacteroidaceae bacterium]
MPSRLRQQFCEMPGSVQVGALASTATTAETVFTSLFSMNISMDSGSSALKFSSEPLPFKPEVMV